jgi:hypothetical protein
MDQAKGENPETSRAGLSEAQLAARDAQAEPTPTRPPAETSAPQGDHAPQQPTKPQPSQGQPSQGASSQGQPSQENASQGQSSQGASSQGTSSQSASNGSTISEKQIKRIYGIGLNEGGYTKAGIDRLIQRKHGFESKSDIPRGDAYEQICEDLADEQLAAKFNRDPDTPDMFDGEDSGGDEGEPEEAEDDAGGTSALDERLQEMRERLDAQEAYEVPRLLEQLDEYVQSWPESAQERYRTEVRSIYEGEEVWTAVLKALDAKAQVEALEAEEGETGGYESLCQHVGAWPEEKKEKGLSILTGHLSADAPIDVRQRVTFAEPPEELA